MTSSFQMIQAGFRVVRVILWQFLLLSLRRRDWSGGVECFPGKRGGGLVEYRSSAGAGAGVGSWSLAWGAGGRGVSLTLRWLGLRSRGRGGWGRRARGRLRRWCAGSWLSCGRALSWGARGGLVGMRAPGLAVLLVLDLLEVLLAGPHLSVF